MVKSHTKKTLPVSGRPYPENPAWLHESSYLMEAGNRSLKTETTYRSGLRLFADWLQHYGRNNYSLQDPWPLNPKNLTTAVILNFRNWLLANRSRSTATTYTSAVIGYLHYLDGQDNLPPGVQLGKLQRQMSRRSVDRNQAETVIDLDIVRQSIPQIVTYYDALPLPPENDTYNRRLSLLRDRALVHTLYATAARISEVTALNRSSVDNGRAAYATITGKGNKPRTIYLRDYAQKSIQRYLAERRDSNPALFVSHSRNSLNARISITSVHNIIKKAVKALHLHPSLSAHDFRHFRATQLLREGMPLEVVQEYLGHADIATTRNIYAPVLGAHIVSEWLDQLDLPPDRAAAPDRSLPYDESPNLE
ncbi:MAG: tyrosine-type recombinase/integrase [Chloroflexi bacterium]|nr:tyrosine-type recombinase/integrase [Chloroflexota bacterium]